MVAPKAIAAPIPAAATAACSAVCAPPGSYQKIDDAAPIVKATNCKTYQPMGRG